MVASNLAGRILSVCLLAGVCAEADPIPVHTATVRVGPRPTTAQRLAVADAVAGVFSAGLSGVLSATESHTRVETLAPAALSCGDTACVGAIRTALGARAVVLVRMEVSARHRLHLTVDVLDRRGESLCRAESEEPIGAWDDAIALARVVARPLMERVRDAESAPPPPPPAQSPVQAPVVASPTRLEPVVVTPVEGPVQPMVPPGETTRRPAEAALGVALLAGGITAASFGLLSVVRNGSTAPGTPPENGTSVYVAGARDYALLGVGGAAMVVGAIVMIDGLRARTQPRVMVGMTGGPGAMGLWVHGVF